MRLPEHNSRGNSEGEKLEGRFVVRCIQGDAKAEDSDASHAEFIPDLPRSPVWTHPATAYVNAESYFPSTHPFGQVVNRNAAAYRYRAFQRPVSPAPYVNAFPRRGIGPNRSPAHLQPYLDPVYTYQPPPQRIPLEQQSFTSSNQCPYRKEYDPSPLPPYVESPHRSRSSSVLDFKAADEAIDQTSSVMQMEESKQSSGTSNSTNEGSSETESVEQADEHPVGATPIFHPLPSMFHRLPRPLRFPVNNNKELPTLALFQNCSLESKVVSDYSDSHQELSLMLALPGLSAHQAPLLSLQQAGDILQTINNPLVVLKVGRLTRKLVPNPALLKPTDDVGTLALWLSPTSDVRLFWHSFLKGPTSETARDVEEQIAQIRTHGEGSPYKELFSHVELSEELAWVAAESDQVDGGCGIRLEIMEHDPSGRSFKLTRKKSHDRQKTELASKLATEQEKTGDPMTEETQKLRQLLATCMSEDPEEEDSYFFWIAEPSVSEGMQTLNAMQNRLDHLPTLAGESGVPEKKLQELYDWFYRAQEAASTDSSLNHEIASWIDLRSGASVPSQLFSNDCPANVPNWSESQPSTSDNPAATGSTIREGCALSATANFLVADKKWGLTHLATASVMVAVGVESTGLFNDEEKAHLDLSHCAHELAKKRAEAGASAEAERLGRIRLEELVAVKSLNELRSKKAETSPTVTPQRTELHGVGSQSEELIQQQQRAMRQSLMERNSRRRASLQPYGAWHTPHLVPGQSIQGNSVWHHSHVHAHPDVVTHMPDYFRQHVHYGVPMDQHQSVHHLWMPEYGPGNAQVMAQYQQYENPSWSVPNAFHPHPWPYGHSAPPPVYQPAFVPPPPPSQLPTFFPRHLPPQLPFLQVAQLRNNPHHKQPNMSLVRIAQEARKKVARVPRERVRAGPSGSNLTAANVDINQDLDDAAYAWHESAHQLGALYQSSLNVRRAPESESVSETRTLAETPKNTTAEDRDKA